jgi:hypothetical protein
MSYLTSPVTKRDLWNQYLLSEIEVIGSSSEVCYVIANDYLYEFFKTTSVSFWLLAQLKADKPLLKSFHVIKRSFYDSITYNSRFSLSGVYIE